MKQRPIKTAGHCFAKQRARRQRRREEAQSRAASGVKSPLGLRQRILTAPTVRCISNRFESGSSFVYASDKTRRQWSATAKRRTEQLS